MAIWLWHGIAVCGYLALWLHDYIAIELDGYSVLARKVVSDLILVNSS